MSAPGPNIHGGWGTLALVVIAVCMVVLTVHFV